MTPTERIFQPHRQPLALIIIQIIFNTSQSTFFRHPRTSLIRNLFLHALRFPFDLQALPTFKCANMISERIISLKVRIICWLIFVSLHKYHKQINDINIFFSVEEDNIVIKAVNITPFVPNSLLQARIGLFYPFATYLFNYRHLLFPIDT